MTIARFSSKISFDTSCQEESVALFKTAVSLRMTLTRKDNLYHTTLAPVRIAHTTLSTLARGLVEWKDATKEIFKGRGKKSIALFSQAFFVTPFSAGLKLVSEIIRFASSFFGTLLSPSLALYGHLWASQIDLKALELKKKFWEKANLGSPLQTKKEQLLPNDAIRYFGIEKAERLFFHTAPKAALQNIAANYVLHTRRLLRFLFENCPNLYRTLQEERKKNSRLETLLKTIEEPFSLSRSPQELKHLADHSLKLYQLLVRALPKEQAKQATQSCLGPFMKDLPTFIWPSAIYGKGMAIETKSSLQK